MSYLDSMYAALAKYLRDTEGLDVVRVVDFEDRTEYDGYCETCYYERTVCDITYLDSDDNTQVFVYDDAFSDLVRQLS